MEYIYDVTLNYQFEYIDFYEWNVSDKIENISKIKLYKIKSKDYLNLKYNDVVVDTKIHKNFFNKILVTNGLEAMGLLFTKEGKLLKRSSILLNEQNNILNKVRNKKSINIKYIKNIKKEIIYIGRVQKEKIVYLNNFFKNIDLIKDEYLLKYIHYSITNIIEEDTKKVYDKLLKIKDENLNKLYNTIMNINELIKKTE